MRNYTLSKIKTHSVAFPNFIWIFTLAKAFSDELWNVHVAKRSRACRPLGYKNPFPYPSHNLRERSFMKVFSSNESSDECFLSFLA